MSSYAQVGAGLPYVASPPSTPSIATPRLDDDGQTLTLDLHGARVDDAERLAAATVIEAARHGRQSVRIIHGSSTTDRDGGNRTIKTALYALLDSGGLSRHVASAFRDEGRVLLAIAPAPRPVPGRIRWQDVQ